MDQAPQMMVQAQAVPRPARKIAILGTVGVPANYGGFETLVDNLLRHERARHHDLHVICSARAYAERPRAYQGARLSYLPLSANGAASIAYDIWSLILALWRGCDVILLLGVSGAIALPLVRGISGARIITNIDGIEWRREKWRGAAKWFLRVSERLAVRYSHRVIADNAAIAEYVGATYGTDCAVIAYGGDHALEGAPAPARVDLPMRYALALCRIEPENNVAMILEAMAAQNDLPLVFVGNWDRSAYGRALRERYGSVAHLHLLDPIYDPGPLKALRQGAAIYLHGHSAGGTNPSLVEMMHFGLPIACFDCSFNRATTEDAAGFFTDASGLSSLVAALSGDREGGAQMLRIARQRYTWAAIGAAYFDLLEGAT